MMWVVPAVRPACKTLGILVVAGMLALSSAFAVSGPNGTEAEGTDERAGPALAQRFAPPEDPLPQEDGESGRDADAECVPGVPPSIIVERDQETRGTVRPPVDRADHFGVPVEVGEPEQIHFMLEQNPDFPMGIGPFQHRALFLSPLCEVLAESADLLMDPLEGEALVDEPGVYVFAVFWDDHGLWPDLPQTQRTDTEGTHRGDARMDQECHQYCTSYRFNVR